MGGFLFSKQESTICIKYFLNYLCGKLHESVQLWVDFLLRVKGVTIWKTVC